MRTVQDLLKSVDIEKIVKKRDEEYKSFVSNLFGPEMRFDGNPLYTDKRSELNIKLLKELTQKSVKRKQQYLYILKHPEDKKEEISPYLIDAKSHELFSDENFYDDIQKPEICLNKLMLIQYNSINPSLESIEDILGTTLIENKIMSDSEMVDILVPFLLISVKEGNKELVRIMTDDSVIHKRFVDHQKIEYDKTIYTRIGQMLIPNKIVEKRQESLKDEQIQKENLQELNLLKSLFIQ